MVAPQRCHYQDSAAKIRRIPHIINVMYGKIAYEGHFLDSNQLSFVKTTAFLEECVQLHILIRHGEGVRSVLTHTSLMRSV